MELVVPAEERRIQSENELDPTVTVMRGLVFAFKIGPITTESNGELNETEI